MSHPRSDVASLTVHLDAVLENYRLCRRLAGSAEVAGVVKADAYGLGMEPVSRALAQAGCDTFFVARLEEGVRLRPLVPLARIFVLDGAQNDSAPLLQAHKLIPVLNSLGEIAIWSAAARAMRTTLEAALHFDTGMNRSGLPADELRVLATETTARLDGLKPILVMSHLACGEDPRSPMNALQLKRFRAALAMLPPAPASLASSGGLMLGEDYAFDMVRPGIALYGGNPQPENPNPFRTVAILTGRILQLSRVDKGESVGYGATFRAMRPTTLATVALGYADGLMRAIGNKGVGAIAGIRAPVAGRVSMDLITLDVTDVPEAVLQTGAEVEFLGNSITLEELAMASNTASYEILTSLGTRAPRRYVGVP